MAIQLSELLFEEYLLYDHRVDQQIQSRIPVPDDQAFFS
jgi:hypothetical protein